jgi:hypothetical protein
VLKSPINRIINSNPVYSHCIHVTVCVTENTHFIYFYWMTLEPSPGIESVTASSNSPSYRDLNCWFGQVAINLSPPLSLSLWLYCPLLDFDRFFSFLIFYAVGRTPWAGDQPIAVPYLHIEQHELGINARRHPCLEWNSNTRSQYSSGRR